MTSKDTLNIAQNQDQGTVLTNLSCRFRQTVWALSVLLTAFSLLFSQMALVNADGPGDGEMAAAVSVREPGVLYALAQNGQGQEAVTLLAEAAAGQGGWAPAPGNIVAFDSNMAYIIRGSVQIVDQPPGECAFPKLSRGLEEVCQLDYVSAQHLVRFGRGLFLNPSDVAGSDPWLAFDDLLAVYIEEVGHSWQEYQYETEGQGSGERTRVTTYEEGMAHIAGWEYQIKRYILHLDGSLLTLSAEERARFLGAICRADGYANPTGRSVSPYGPPPGWPQPEGWPTSAPSAVELATFCAGA